MDIKLATMERGKAYFTYLVGLVTAMGNGRGVSFIKLGDTGRILRVRWWDRSYTEKREILDRVNTAVHNALNAERIEIPTPPWTNKPYR